MNPRTRTDTVLKRIRRCRFCANEMTVSSLSYAENPYCTSCLRQRGKSTTGIGKVQSTTDGHYIRFSKKGG